MSYKDTLNLPKTSFSMKANLSVLEPNIIDYWQKIDIYQTLRKQRRGCEKFILHDGPPYANGLIHIGHALNKILKDIVIKYKLLRGYDCPFIIGWDCHGLPVEHQLFKELELTKHDVDVLNFRSQAQDYALKFVKLQGQDFIRLGVFADWQNPYLTLDSSYEYSVIKLLQYLVAEGYVYRGRRPVNWCASCETALAEAEVEYLDKESDSIYLLFKVKDDRGIFSNFKFSEVFFLIWTTTPWTLISNVAVAVHPDLEYCLVQFKDKKFVVAKDLLSLLEEEFQSELKVCRSYPGKKFEGLSLEHPFLERESQVVLADFVSKEEGSGCVHIAPGHGAEDFSLTKKYNLDVVMPLNDKGIFQDPPEFKGKDLKQASQLVLEKLKRKNILLKASIISHSYPHCWRCKQPIIFRATYQWFINLDHNHLRTKALAEIERINWIPDSGKERMRNMLLLRPDWCLSRQRLWGVPIPALTCKTCGETFLDKEVLGRVAEIFKVKGSNSWFSLDLAEFLPSKFSCPRCQKKEFSKEYDIIDVWFESGASFLAVLKNNSELNFPADLYLEGSDQHRGWFQVSLIPSVAKENIAPFKSILTHGFVVDGEGKKMSKSLGNVIGPQEIIKDYGAEILRLWAAYSDYREDVKISPEIIKQLVDIYRKVRNTIRFILGNLYDFNLTPQTLNYQDLLEIDQFMLSKAALLFKEAILAYEEFRFYKVCQAVFNFCNLDLSSFYLDILKDRLYTFFPNSPARRSAQFVLYHILEIVLKLIAPILSFTAEEAYRAWTNIANKQDSIFNNFFDLNAYERWINEALTQRWQELLSLRSQVLKEIERKREDGLIGSSLEAEVIITCSQKKATLYRRYQKVLSEVFIVSKVTIKEGIFAIRVEKAGGRKCLRCWNWSETVGKNSDHPDLCNRCLQVLKGGK